MIFHTLPAYTYLLNRKLSKDQSFYFYSLLSLECFRAFAFHIVGIIYLLLQIKRTFLTERKTLFFLFRIQTLQRFRKADKYLLKNPQPTLLEQDFQII